MRNPHHCLLCFGELIVLVTAGVLFAGDRVTSKQTRQPAPPDWSSGFHTSKAYGGLATATYDDGFGPALYVGGSFRFQGFWDTWALSLAKWDGRQWNRLPELGPYTPQIDMYPGVKAMTVFDDGRGPALFVGGCFVTAGDVTANAIARWDGQAWSGLGSGVDDAFSCGESRDRYVTSVAVFDDGAGSVLIAAGDFPTMDGQTVNNIAKWDGSQWSALGNGIDGTVMALAVFDDGRGPALYAAVSNYAVPSSPSFGVYKWDGSNWKKLPDLNGAVWSLTAFQGAPMSGLYAGGSFTEAGGKPTNYLARWNGSEWIPVPGLGGGGHVGALAVFNDGTETALFVGGKFTKAGDVHTNCIAKWNGRSWSGLSGGIDPSAGAYERVTALSVADLEGTPRLLVSGTFLSVGGQAPTAVAAATLPLSGLQAKGMAQWDGTEWHAMPGPRGAGLNGSIFDLLSGDDGNGPGLFAAGHFTESDGIELRGIGKWNGTGWSTLGRGMNHQANGLCFHDDGSGRALYAVGAFTSAGGAPARRVARWDGKRWSAVGAGLGEDDRNRTVLAVETVATGMQDGLSGLYAAGDFSSTGDGQYVRYIARWDGFGWNDVGGGTPNPVSTLACFDDGRGKLLYAGGSFGVRSWNGTSWQSVGTGLVDVNELKVLDDGSGPALFAGWDKGLSKWDGATWVRLANTLHYPVYAVAMYDDGSGPFLYAAGWFFTINNAPLYHIARWDGTAWHGLNSYVDNAVFALAVFDDGTCPGLFLGGSFQRAGDTVSRSLAKWAPGLFERKVGDKGIRSHGLGSRIRG